MNLGPLKDKRVQLAAAGAAVLGVVVLLRKGSGDASAAGSDQSGQSINTGTLDSTGTDSYNAISQLGQAWQDEWNNAFQGFSDQLGDISDQLGQINGPSAPSPTNPPTTLPSKTPVPGPTKKPAPKPAAKKTYVTATKFTTSGAARGSNWESTLSTIAAHYHTTTAKILKLNPGIKNANLIHPNQKIRVS